MVLGLAFVDGAVRLYRRADRRTALPLYLFSLAYLALLFASMVIDRRAVGFAAMDRKLARKNIRTGLMLGAFGAVHVRPHVRGRRDLHLVSDRRETDAAARPASRSTSPARRCCRCCSRSALTLALVGVTLELVLTVIGIVIAIPTLVLWIRSAREDSRSCRPATEPVGALRRWRRAGWRRRAPRRPPDAGVSPAARRPRGSASASVACCAIGCRDRWRSSTTSPRTPHRPPVTRAMILRLVAIGVVAAAIGIVIGLEIPWFPPAAAKQAHTIDTLYYVLIIVHGADLRARHVGRAVLGLALPHAPRARIASTGRRSTATRGSR